MLNRIFRSSLIAVFVWLAGIRPVSAQIIPNPAMSPTPTIPPIIDGPTPPPTPTRPPISPPPVSTPTVPPVNPPPVSTPTVPPVNPPPVSTPTVPPVSPPPVSTPTVPPVNPPPVATPTVRPVPNPNALVQADPQVARAVIYYGQNGALTLPNDRGRFQKVALQPDEVITVVLTLSPLDYGKPAAIELLDGGSMSTSVSVPKPKDILPSISPAPSPTINSVPFSGTAPAPGPLPSPTPLPVAPGPPPPAPDPSTLLDTGALMTVTQSGELTFAFKPGADAGRHRISVIVGGNQYYLQFWRQDQSAPNNNPRMPHAY
jgi:hypothetical protein